MFVPRFKQNIFCGQKVECLDVKLVVHKVKSGLYRDKYMFVRAT